MFVNHLDIVSYASGILEQGEISTGGAVSRALMYC